MILLKWFRDCGCGQIAANDIGASQSFDGSWPIAILRFHAKQEADDAWRMLYVNYGINASTEHNP